MTQPGIVTPRRPRRLSERYLTDFLLRFTILQDRDGQAEGRTNLVAQRANDIAQLFALLIGRRRRGGAPAVQTAPKLLEGTT